jgi:LCP family protein required for cell wall assembly
MPGYGAQKINAAHVYGGLALTAKTIRELTGVRIDYYVMTNPKAVIKLVDLLGGITLYVEKDMRYIDRAGGLDINLKEGWRRLNGKEAHDYIRFRHDNEGDIGRVARQQNFFRAVNQSLHRPTNIIKAPFAILSALGEVKTDLPLGQAVRLLMFFRTLKAGDVRTATLSGEALNVEGVGACWVPNKQDTAAIVKEFF